MKSHFAIDGPNVVTSSNLGNKIGVWKGKLFFKFENGNVYSRMYDKHTPSPSGWSEALPDKDITLIVAPLYLQYKMTDEDVNLVVNLKNIRNRDIAHGGNPCSLSLDDLLKIFNRVVVKVLSESFVKSN